jgi:hypothetical protein
MTEVKIRLRPVLNHMWDGDEVVLLTTTPQSSLDEWLALHYEPLENFRYTAGRSNLEGRLISKTNPNLHILIETSYIEPTKPRNVLQFGAPRKWRPARR